MQNRKARRTQESQLRGLRNQVKTIDLTKISLSSLPSKGSPLSSCYANILGNCEGGISREHFISKNILEQIGNLSTNGIPWLQHLEGTIKPSSLVAKCLCQKHNNFLSPLDVLSGKVFSTFKGFANRTNERVIIPGKLFELSMLKMLIGSLGTKRIEYKSKKYIPADLEAHWIRVLYGQEPMPEGCGLYIHTKIGETLKIVNSISVSHIFLENQVVGLSIDIAGFKFLFTLVSKEQAFKKDHPDYDEIMYHPGGYNKNPYPQEIKFVWD